MNTILFFGLATQTAGDAATAGGTTGSVLSMVLSIGLMLVVFYFFLIRPQKKKEKESKNMKENLQIGDEVTTIGGITGIIVRKAEDTVVIETGGEKNKIRVKIWAISENATSHDDAEQAAASKKKKID